MLSSSRSGNKINLAQCMEPNYLTRPDIGHGFPKMNSLATSAGTSASATGWEKMLRCQWEGGTHRRPRTHTLSNHSFLALVAWRMNVAKENPHFESSCIERNKSRKSVSMLKFCWVDFSLIELNTIEKWGYFERSDENCFQSKIQHRSESRTTVSELSTQKRQDRFGKKQTCKNWSRKTDIYKMRLYAVQEVLLT